MNTTAQTQDIAPAHAVGDELPPGTTLCHGQYRIIRYLNAGGFGVTYMAVDSLNRQVVIKECFPGAMCCRHGESVRVRSRSHGDEFARVVELFKKEAHALAQLAHANIVGVHQIFEDNGTAYMALDFVDGPDLFHLYEASPELFTPTELNRVLICLLDALSYVHGNGILHRDISPDNILMGPDKQPVLIDFGAARAGAAQASRILSRVHTVKDGYSPQEFYLIGSPQSRSSDLYALAATMYHLVTGNPPPHSNLRLACVAEGRPDPYTPLVGRVPGFDGRFLGAIDRCLSLFARDRIQSAEAWREFLVAERRVGATDTRRLVDRNMERRVSNIVAETRKAIEADLAETPAEQMPRPIRAPRTRRIVAPEPEPKGPDYWAILNEDPREIAREIAAWDAQQAKRENRATGRAGRRFSLRALLPWRRRNAEFGCDEA